MKPFYEDHTRILTHPAARHPRHTLLQPLGDRVWSVSQRLIDPDEHDDWAIHATVDLTTGVPSDGPLIQLDRLGV
jgi:hypothetical protein